MVYICFKCKEEIPQLSQLRWHLRTMHNVISDDEPFMCFQDGCMRTFCRYSSYRKHLVNIHPQRVGTETEMCTSAGFNISSEESHSEDGDGEDLNTSDVAKGEIENASDDTSLWSLHDEYGVCTPAAVFVAKMRAGGSMTMSNADIVVENSTDMVKSILEHLQKFTLNKLKIVAENPEDLLNIQTEVQAEFEAHEQPFHGLTSQYLENKYFARDGSLIMPQEKVLGHRIDQKNHRILGVTTQAVKSDTFSYVPLQAVRKRFLELPGVWEAIQENKSKDDGVLRDFHDGLYYKNHALLCQPNCLSLGLYNDDMETTNPLGSHTGIHKLGFFYYIVKELPAIYNSSLSNCHVLQVYYSADRKKYGFSSILENLVDELKHLSREGMHIFIDGIEVHVRVALGQVSGDNLGMHGLFGFTESFSANHPCRFCIIHKEAMQHTYTHKRKNC